MVHSSLKWLALWILLDSVSFNLSFYHDNVPCYPDDGHCKCEFPNGLGIDLSPLNGTNFTIPAGKNLTLMYFPCQNEQVKNITNSTVLNECGAGVSLCLKREEGNVTYFYNVGSLADSSFLWERINNDPVLIFTHGNTTSHINLDCNDASLITNFSLSSQSSLNNFYELRLSTYLACVNTVEAEGRSVVSTFIIICLFLFLMYFLGGFFVLKFIRGANGWEAIPNGEFWRKFIDTIRKTFAYLLSGCRQPETYDSI